MSNEPSGWRFSPLGFGRIAAVCLILFFLAYALTAWGLGIPRDALPVLAFIIAICIAAGL